MLNELKSQRTALSDVVQLSEQVRQGYAREGQPHIDLHIDGSIDQFFSIELDFIVVFI